MTIGDIIGSESDLALQGEERYGKFYKNAYDFWALLQDFIGDVKPDAWIFVAFLSQIRKHYTLALLSCLRAHHVQGMHDLRQVLESGTNAAYAIAHPIQKDFVVQDNQGVLDAPQNLVNKRYKWLNDNHKKMSDFIKNMKKNINSSCAHSNFIYAFQNFKLTNNGGQRVFETPFFDVEDDYLIKGDLWMMSNIALGLMDLFYGVNQENKILTFVDDFVPRLKHIEKDNHELKAELMQNPKYIKSLQFKQS